MTPDFDTIGAAGLRVLTQPSTVVNRQPFTVRVQVVNAAGDAVRAEGLRLTPEVPAGFALVHLPGGGPTYATDADGVASIMLAVIEDHLR